MEPDLRIILDGDDSKIFHQGESVSGRVILTTEKELDLKGLSITFRGVCTTQQSAWSYTSNNGMIVRLRDRLRTEEIQLFEFAQHLLPQCTLRAKKYCFTFCFDFPSSTTRRYCRKENNTMYIREPHQLPPSFQSQSCRADNSASVVYALRSHLLTTGEKNAISTTTVLTYQPMPQDRFLGAVIASRILYAQTWRPYKDQRGALDKVLSKLTYRSRSDDAELRFIPTLHFPERICPRQNIPLMLTMTKAARSVKDSQARPITQCTLKALTVTLSTCTSTVCSSKPDGAEDNDVRHVDCIDKHDLNIPLPFDTRTKLTDNFRLVENGECVPSFTTYTIARRYDLSVNILLQYEEQTFRIRCKTALKILRRPPRDFQHAHSPLEDEEDETLPLYEPREPSKEYAPDYFSIYSSRTPSSSNLSAYTDNASGSESPGSGVSTPQSERTEPSRSSSPTFSTTAC